MMIGNLFYGLALLIYLSCAICLFIYVSFNKNTESDETKKKINYNKKKIFLIIYQLLAGILLVVIYEKTNEMFIQLSTLLALIINTLSLIIFIVKNNKDRKELKCGFSILSVLAIICGILFSAIGTMTFVGNVSVGYDNGLREILYLETYDKEEAKDFLNNIYEALYYDNGYEVGECLSLNNIHEKRNTKNVYIIDLSEICSSYEFPGGVINLEVKNNDKTKIERIYWAFNDNHEIDLYKDGKQVEDFKYLYKVMGYIDEPPYYIKDKFENDVKGKLKSPSSAKFTYNGISHSYLTNNISYNGWVEAQNSFGAMVKEDFSLTLLPCKGDNCDSVDFEYQWNFK